MRNPILGFSIILLILVAYYLFRPHKCNRHCYGMTRKEWKLRQGIK